MNILAFDWAFLFQWMVATTMGWIVGSLLFPAVALPAAGIFIGAFQAFILKERLARPLRWVAVSLAGWLAGYLLLLAINPGGLAGVSGLVLGLAVGTAQWLVLRGEVKWAAWWIAFSVMAWVTGLALLPGFLLTGTLAGVITGFVMEVLMRNRKD